MSAISEIEQMIKDKGADKGPRISEQSIKDKILDVTYYRQPTIALTICTVEMMNGFVFIGHSAAASPSNYNAEIGDKISYENAFRQIWSHEGYLLKERLYLEKTA